MIVSGRQATANENIQSAAKSLAEVERLREKLKATSEKTARIKKSLEKEKAKNVQLATRAAIAEGRLDALEGSLLSLAEKAVANDNLQLAQEVTRLAIDCQPRALPA